MKTITAILVLVVGNVSSVHANRAEKLKKEIMKREIAKEKEKSKASSPHPIVK